MNLSRLTALAGAPSVREGLSADTDRVEEVVRDKAEPAFWEAVAAAYPEIKTGDLDPGATMKLIQAMESAVEAWLDANEA